MREPFLLLLHFFFKLFSIIELKVLQEGGPLPEPETGLLS